MMGFQLDVDQRIELVGTGDAARRQQAQIVGDEFGQVVVGEELGILAEDLAGLRFIDIGFKRHHALLARLDQQVIEQREGVHVVLLLVLGALQHFGNRGESSFHDFHRISDHEGAKGRAANNNQFIGLPQSRKFTVGQNEAAGDAAEHDDDADDEEHGPEYD